MATNDEALNSAYTKVVALALYSPAQDQFLIFRRNQNQSGSGKWEFPGGKVEAFESLTQALIREIQEELDLNLNENQLVYIGENRHDYGTKKIHILLYQYNLDKPVFKLVDHDQSAWIDQSNYDQYDISDADLPFLALIF